MVQIQQNALDTFRNIVYNVSGGNEMKQVIFGKTVLIQDWVDGERGTWREWAHSDWDGSCGDVFRRTHREVSRRDGGRVRWFRVV